MVSADDGPGKGKKAHVGYRFANTHLNMEETSNIERTSGLVKAVGF